MSRRFLIGQIACFGDCLYATTVAKQIKHDLPDSHITWAVAAKYRSVLDHNPHIDRIWELPIHTRHIRKEDWDAFEREAEERKRRGEFDEILYTQVIGPHVEEFVTTLRQALFSIAKRRITVEVAPVIRLTAQEIENVTAFAQRHQLARYRHVVLFECTPSSNQSKLDVDFALALAAAVARAQEDVCFILSSTTRIGDENPHIVDASVLSFRENAELTKHCTLLIGCSSGITWLATSDHAKKLPMLQLLNPRSPIFAGVNFDFEMQRLDNRELVELIDYDLPTVIACVEAMLSDGAAAARARFHQRYAPNYHSLEATALILDGRGDSPAQIRAFVRRYLRENAALGNPIAFNPIHFWGRLFYLRLRNSQRYPIRVTRELAKRVLRRLA